MAYTGQSLKRFEDPRLLTGQGAFLDDLTFPDMLYAAVLRSPHAHAAIRAIDTAAARYAPGVIAVITAEDLEGVVEPLPTRRETEAQELRPPVHPPGKKPTYVPSEAEFRQSDMRNREELLSALRG